MGKTVVLRCTCCGEELEVAWGKEFYVSRDGEEKLYGYPNPLSEEAEERGISGFWVDKICRDCGELVRESRYIEDVTNEYTDAWVHFPKVDIIERCESCKGENLMTVYEVILGEDAKIPCPNCREGKLIVDEIIQD